MSLSLDERADRLEQDYRATRRGHGRSHQKWLALRDARKKAVRANTRKARVTKDLPLFRGIAA